MFRTLKADKDSYITNKYVDGVRAVSGNVGIAGSLDLFKLYGITITGTGSNKTPQVELSRILVHFNLDPIKSLFSSGVIDINHPSFKCHMLLKDVYGGQTTPSEFRTSVFPLSASFEEGFGKDTAYYADKDVCNFLSSSKSTGWFLSGCAKECNQNSQGDYITSTTSIANTEVTQFFTTGEEDLFVDVTKIVSATISGELPDAGFRVSFTGSLESDTHTYFVKRFGSRHSYNESKRPQLIFRFDDSIEDDTANLMLDVSSSLFLYNYTYGQPTNLLSASQTVTGTNSLLLEMKTFTSGVGNYSLFFTGSQHFYGSNPATGIYSASIFIPTTDINIRTNLSQSGSVTFTPIWSSFDKTVAYLTGSKIVAMPPERSSKRLSPLRFTVSVTGLNAEHTDNEDLLARVYLFDENDPIVKAKKLPVITPGKVRRNCYYAVRDVNTNEYLIPFDTQYQSTRLSSDAEGMYMTFNTSALLASRTYVIDIMITTDGKNQKFLDASPRFLIRKV